MVCSMGDRCSKLIQQVEALQVPSQECGISEQAKMEQMENVSACFMYTYWGLLLVYNTVRVFTCDNCPFNPCFTDNG